MVCGFPFLPTFPFQSLAPPSFIALDMFCFFSRICCPPVVLPTFLLLPIRRLTPSKGKPNIDLATIPPHTPGLTDEDGWERISEESTDTWSTDVQFGEEGLIDRLKGLFSVWMTILKIGSVRGVGRPGRGKVMRWKVGVLGEEL